MPIYEYRCTACAAELEKLQKISDPPLLQCPACDKPALVKLVSASSFRLKGGGWYETDFKTGKKKNGAGDGAGESGGGEGSAGAKAGDNGAAASAAQASGKADSAAGSSKGGTDKTAAGAA